MLPKKIYLNYVNEEDDNITWSEEPVGVGDCDMQNREYTDLGQVWHLSSELPNKRAIVVITKDDEVVSGDFDERGWGVFQYTDCMADWDSVVKWTYIEDFLTLIK